MLAPDVNEKKYKKNSNTLDPLELVGLQCESSNLFQDI